MKILIAGDWHSDLHEEVMLRSLQRLGHEVHGFKWHDYFSAAGPDGPRWTAIMLRAQNKFVAGPTLARINRDFVATALRVRPDMVFVYRGTHIEFAALRALRAALPGCVVVGYNNDDPFAPSQPAYLWRHFMRAIPEYDLMLAYRHANLDAFARAGARRVELMRSWYVAERNHPVELSASERDRFATDVVFVGHYEADGRLEHLEDVVRGGYDLRLFGPTKYWDEPLRRSPLLRHLAPVRMVWGKDYNLALCGAKIALCFLSKLNRDTYTRRCFEIPATQTLMLSEYSADLATLYHEGCEADFFRSRDEMMQKIGFYLGDDAARDRVAEAGHRRLTVDGHDVDSRMRELLRWVEELYSVRVAA